MPKLIVVGSGIKSIAHITEETKKIIQMADKVLYLVNEDYLKQWLVREAQTAESLEPIYFAHENRAKAYQAITDYILADYQNYETLCVVFYGHPTVFAESALNAVQQIKNKGGEAIILPAISTMDCLFADLQIDPGDQGLFCIEATELLLYERRIDPHSQVIIFQAANLGRVDVKNSEKIKLLEDYLKQFYPANHRLCIYEASILPGGLSRIDWIKLEELSTIQLTGLSTLFIPALNKSKPNSTYLNLLFD